MSNQENFTQSDKELEEILDEVFEIGYQQGLAGNTGATKLRLNSSHFMAALHTHIKEQTDKADLLARIDELKKVPKDRDYFTAIKIHPYITDRIAELESSLKRDTEDE